MLEQLACNDHGVLGNHQILEQDHELVAAQAGHGIDGTKAMQQALADLAQQLIA